jgi:riboflavin synthase
VKYLAPVMNFEHKEFGAFIEVECAELATYKIGGSIMINGACMTLVKVDNGLLSFEVIKESLEKTNLKDLKVGDFVNLESSLTLQDYIDGHLVSGHIDCKVKCVKVIDNEFYFELLPEISRFISMKGSVALNGISLTISGLFDDSFKVSLIPETLSNTNLKYIKAGNFVNLEVDVVARYLDRLNQK